MGRPELEVPWEVSGPREMRAAPTGDRWVLGLSITNSHLQRALLILSIKEGFFLSLVTLQMDTGSQAEAETSLGEEREPGVEPRPLTTVRAFIQHL